MSCDFLTVPWVGLVSVIVVFPDHTQLFFETPELRIDYMCKLATVKYLVQWMTDDDALEFNACVCNYMLFAWFDSFCPSKQFFRYIGSSWVEPALSKD